VIGPWRPHISILQNGPSENRTLLIEQFRCQKLTTFRVPIGFSRSTVKAHVVVRSERQTLNANTLEELPGCAVNLLPVQSPFVFLRAEIRGAAGAQHTTALAGPGVSRPTTTTSANGTPAWSRRIEDRRSICWRQTAGTSFDHAGYSHSPSMINLSDCRNLPALSGQGVVGLRLRRPWRHTYNSDRLPRHVSPRVSCRCHPGIASL
jgi:hypothetical protein